MLSDSDQNVSVPILQDQCEALLMAYSALVILMVLPWRGIQFSIHQYRYALPEQRRLWLQ